MSVFAAGHASLGLMLAVKNKMKYPYLVDDAGNWSERKDVRFVRMMQGKGLMANEWMGIKTGTIGPESIWTSAKRWAGPWWSC